jgi:hypothetical protein
VNQPDQPVAGYYKRRLVKNGPWIPVRIWFSAPTDPHQPGETLDRSPRWQAELDGREIGIWDVWPACSGHPIDEAEFRYMIATAAHARKHEPHMPEADPDRSIDLNRLPPLF